MADRTVNVTVCRYDPARDDAPRMHVYGVPLTEGMSVLGALDYIYENLDATLAYYDHAACAQGICKTCLAKINGKAGLLCQTLLTDDVTLEPAGKFKVVRDLVTETGGRAA
jgi:succinate dehydrogenase/fumarate reductase-like Fe-S protein